MKKATRDKVKELLFQWRMDSMFGDGLEADYIRDGVHIVGLNEMSDDDLLSELEEMAGEDDDSEEFELLMQAREEGKE